MAEEVCVVLELTVATERLAEQVCHGKLYLLCVFEDCMCENPCGKIGFLHLVASVLQHGVEKLVSIFL